ncbi:MAG: hypothetical protein ACRDYE_00540, partial [Acidimicrobiales bacterium]
MPVDHNEKWPDDNLGGPRASLKSFITGPLPAVERSTMTNRTSYLESAVRAVATRSGVSGIVPHHPGTLYGFSGGQLVSWIRRNLCRLGGFIGFE